VCICGRLTVLVLCVHDVEARKAAAQSVSGADEAVPSSYGRPLLAKADSESCANLDLPY